MAELSTESSASPHPHGTPWSLRRRLIIGILALLLILGVAIGGVSTAVLREDLVGRLDSQLLASVERSGDVLRGDPVREPPPVGGFVLGEGAGAVGVLIVDGLVIRGGYLSETGDDSLLTIAQLEDLVAVAADGQPHTVSLGDDLGNYRVAINAVSSDTAVIVGLPLADVEATVAQLLLIIGLVTAAALLAAGLLGTLVVRVALRPLDRVVATATRVSELRLDEGEVELAERVPEADTAPTTEVGRVGAALNTLLGRVESALTARQASEDRLRRFVADASHELRTPLAAIRGYSELLRTRLLDRKSLGADAQRSLERIESESIRMTALVEDLLLLARLDAGPDLVTSTVELSRLVVDAVADAQAAGPDHVWQLDLPAEAIVVPGDGSRLHQVVANLLTNARVHTPDGTRVVVSLSTPEPAPGERGIARLVITDDGPGIPGELVPTVFERFVRGDMSRSRSRHDGASTGLGLAIVDALVAAHGGTVAAESRPGRTTFTVELPLDVDVLADD